MTNTVPPYRPMGQGYPHGNFYPGDFGQWNNPQMIPGQGFPGHSNTRQGIPQQGISLPGPWIVLHGPFIYAQGLYPQEIYPQGIFLQVVPGQLNTQQRTYPQGISQPEILQQASQQAIPPQEIPQQETPRPLQPTDDTVPQGVVHQTSGIEQTGSNRLPAPARPSRRRSDNRKHAGSSSDAKESKFQRQTSSAPSELRSPGREMTGPKPQERSLSLHVQGWSQPDIIGGTRYAPSNKPMHPNGINPLCHDFLKNLEISDAEYAAKERKENKMELDAPKRKEPAILRRLRKYEQSLTSGTERSNKRLRLNSQSQSHVKSSINIEGSQEAAIHTSDHSQGFRSSAPEYQLDVYREYDFRRMKFHMLLWLSHQLRSLQSRTDTALEITAERVNFAFDFQRPFLTTPKASEPDDLVILDEVRDAVYDILGNIAAGQPGIDSEHDLELLRLDTEQVIKNLEKKLSIHPHNLRRDTELQEFSEEDCQTWAREINNHAVEARDSRLAALKSCMAKATKKVVALGDHEKFRAVQAEGDPKWAQLSGLSQWVAALEGDGKNAIGLCSEMTEWSTGSMLSTYVSTDKGMIEKHEAVARVLAFAPLLWDQILPMWFSYKLEEFRNVYMTTAELFNNDWNTFEALWSPPHNLLVEAFSMTADDHGMTKFPSQHMFDTYLSSGPGLMTKFSALSNNAPSTASDQQPGIVGTQLAVLPEPTLTATDKGSLSGRR